MTNYVCKNNACFWGENSRPSKQINFCYGHRSFSLLKSHLTLTHDFSSVKNSCCCCCAFSWSTGCYSFPSWQRRAVCEVGIKTWNCNSEYSEYESHGATVVLKSICSRGGEMVGWKTQDGVIILSLSLKQDLSKICLFLPRGLIVLQLGELIVIKVSEARKHTHQGNICSGICTPGDNIQ